MDDIVNIFHCRFNALFVSHVTGDISISWNKILKVDVVSSKSTKIRWADTAFAVKTVPLEIRAAFEQNFKDACEQEQVPSHHLAYESSPGRVHVILPIEGEFLYVFQRVE